MLIRAISVSIWPRNCSASSGGRAARRARGRAAAGSAPPAGRRCCARRVAVIGRRRAHRLEERAAARGARRDSRATSPCSRRSARRAACTLSRKPSNSGSTTGSGRYAVMTRPFQPRRADLRVMRERIERRFGGRQHLDVEPLEQRARPELRLARDSALMRSKHAVGRFRRQSLVDAEHRRERVVEPEPRRRAAEQVVMRGESPPDLARVLLDGRRRRGAECRDPRARRPGCRACGTRSGPA